MIGFELMLKELYTISKKANEILTLESSNELKFQIFNVKRKNRFGILIRFVIGIYIIIKAITYKSKARLGKVRKGHVLSIYSTINQKKALDKIFKSDCNILSINPSLKSNNYICIYNVFSLIKFPFLFFSLFYLYSKKEGVNKAYTLFASCGERFALSILCYEYYDALLLNNDVKSILVANDHNYDIRTLALVSRKHAIKCAYIQHSVVSSAFPDANIFDICFLDGKQAVNSYAERKKLECKYHLVGALRYGLPTSLKKKKSDYHLNIALNDTISMSGIYRLFELVKNKFPENFSVNVRFHNMQAKADEIKNLCVFFDYHIVPNSDPVEDFLSTSMYLVTVSSGIVLDALRAQVLPLVYIDEGTLDDFGYLDSCCCVALEYFDFYSNFENQLQSCISKGKYYDNLIGCSKVEYQNAIDTVRTELSL